MTKKRAKLNLFLVATVALLITQGVFTLPVAAASNSTFSVIWITDTQYLSESYPSYFNSLCQWIVDNKNTYNIKMVIHTGDLVEDEFNQTHWTHANQAMSILLNNDVPYCWNAGNHDFNATCWIGNQYPAFNPQELNKKSYWVSDCFDGQNTAVQLSVSGWDLLVVNLAYRANDSAIAWANNVLNTHNDSHAIVTTHAYLNSRGTYTGKGTDAVHEEWALNFKENLLDKHANVFMVLGGHFYPSSGSRVKVGDREELMFNLQDGYGQIGGASLRILTFDTANGKIDVQTYIRYANQFLEDENNKFTLETKFYNESVPEFPEVAVILSVLAISGLTLVCVNRRMRIQKGVSFQTMSERQGKK